MTTSPRSTFTASGDLLVAFSNANDNAKCDVDVWAIKLDGKYFLANLILPTSAPEGMQWLFGSVAAATGGSVWGYRDDKRVQAGFDGHAFTVATDGVTYLVFATKGKTPQVAYAVPFVEILKQHEVEVSIDVTLTRKRLVADKLGYDVLYTKSESVLVKYLAEQAMEAEKAQREADAKVREEAHKAKVDKILARQCIKVFVEGKPVEAIWVVDGEWQMLPPRTKVILGEFLEGEGHEGIFFPQEVFTVFKDYKKRGSAPTKSYVQKVGHEPTGAMSAAAQLPQPILTRLVMLEGKPFEVPSFAKVEDLQAYRANGLNSGVLRGVVTSKGIDLFRVRATGLEQVSAKAFQVIG